MNSPHIPPQSTGVAQAPVVAPKPILALLLSLVALGAGYYYAGARWRLVALAALVPVLLACIAISVGLGLPPWLLAAFALLSPLVWIDSFLEAHRPGARRPPRAEVAGAALICFVYFNGLSALFQAFVLQSYSVPAASMAPALLDGDSFIADKLAYVLGEPERGDIATLRIPEDQGSTYVKRIIGLPGDVVAITAEGDVEINGTLLPLQRAGLYTDPDPYRSSPLSLLREELAPDRSHLILRSTATRFNGTRKSWTVPDGAYFVLGDNRDASKDSRGWDRTFVPREDVLGRVSHLYWSIDPATKWPRFERIGSLGERVDLPAETSTPAGS